MKKSQGFLNLVSTMEGFVGRKMADSAELQNKSVSSHVARMTTGKIPQKVFEKFLDIFDRLSF